MLANFVKETVSAGGTGALTLGGKVTGFIDFNAAVGVDKYINYTIEDGNNREVGIGHITTSTNFVRDTILETLVSGTLDRTSPTAINVTTAANIMIAATAESRGMHRPGAFLGAGFAGMGPVATKDTDASVTLPTNYLFMMPLRWQASQQISTGAVAVHTGIAAATARIGIYEIDADGAPGKRLINFTETTQLDCATSGLKSQAADAPIYLPAGDYYFAIASSNSSVAWKMPQYGGSFTFLGCNASGTLVKVLYRSFTYANLPADESASSWTETSTDYWATHWIK